jgi:acyl-coenzyme A synthetase/AMP-(fatty) acid ligase
MRAFSVTILITVTAVLAAAQIGAEYKPKFPGDPARSEAEAAAMGYMRVVVNAQKNYSRKHSGQYATSLAQLVGQGSFTRRLLNPHRGDYTARFKGGAKEYSLWMTPATVSPTERAFFVDESGVIRAEEDKEANAESAKAKP